MSFTLIKTAYAQATLPASTSALIGRILENIINPLITLMMAVAIILFLWGVFEFVRNADSSEERKKGGLHIMYGVIGIFIMITAYGILNLVIGTVR